MRDEDCRAPHDPNFLAQREEWEQGRKAVGVFQTNKTGCRSVKPLTHTHSPRCTAESVVKVSLILSFGRVAMPCLN